MRLAQITPFVPAGTPPEGRVRPPVAQDYGPREFHGLDEDGALVFFGQPAT